MHALQARSMQGGLHTEHRKGNPMDTPTPSSPAERKRDRGSVIGGVVLIVIGCLFLADRFLDVRFGDFWPLILVAIGAAMLWRSRDGGHPQGGQL